MSKTRKKHQPHAVKNNHAAKNNQVAKNGSTAKSSAKAQPPVRERGIWLTVAIILVIVHHVILAALAYYDLTNNGIEAKSLYMPVLLLTSVASVIGGIAMWFWKRWGFQLYVASVLVAGTAALMNTGYLVVLGAVILPPIVVAYIYLPRQKFFD